ncbi:MAG: mechanosensitive ion channel [Oceanococcus sp.]|nr:MAG: mechanosensitive ion channel [Oceanococcus sp.]
MTLPQWLGDFVPLLINLGLVTLLLGALHMWMHRHQPADPDAHLPRQMMVLGAWALALLLTILALPISDTTRGQVLSLIGVVITALIALSSTTLVANMMAGLLLRIVNSFRPGDFIRVGEHFGRVSERGLFHTEMQTEDRDLMTLPNMHLITNPVTVVHDTGTIISATVSLGYDVHRKQIEKLLKQAAADAELNDAFVQILELGDFSVLYRIAGRLDDVSSLITARSRLRACMLDTLHDAGVEIVSPTFMNQRPQTDGQKAIPRPERKTLLADEEEPQTKVEDMVFDKAEQASQETQRRKRIDEIKQSLSQMTEAQKDSPERRALEQELNSLLAEEEQTNAQDKSAQPAS